MRYRARSLSKTPTDKHALLLLALASVALFLTLACEDSKAADDSSSTPGVTDLPNQTPAARNDESAPPALTITAGDASLVAGLGSFCWAGLCADAIGYITPEEPLTASARQLLATLSSHTVAEAFSSASLSSSLESQPVCTSDATPVGPLCESSDAHLAWTGELGQGVSLPAAAAGDTIEIDISGLEPGSYVVDIFVRFVSGGDAGYGVLLEVEP